MNAAVHIPLGSSKTVVEMHMWESLALHIGTKYVCIAVYTLGLHNILQMYHKSLQYFMVIGHFLKLFSIGAGHKSELNSTILDLLLVVLIWFCYLI